MGACWPMHHVLVKTPLWGPVSFSFWVQMSCFSLAMEKSLLWSSLESVFLTRRAVRRAYGLWYQHSFMVFAMAARIYENTATIVIRWAFNDGFMRTHCGWFTGWEWSRLCRLGLCWSTETTFLISSKLGSMGTRSKKGGRYSSTIPGGKEILLEF